MMVKEEIIKQEGLLLTALESNDLATIQNLLHDDLIFNIPTGQTITKQMDLENLKSGLMSIDKMASSDQTIHLIEDIAVVAVTISLKANFAGNDINSDFRYLRVWKQFGNTWKVIAGSGNQIL